MTEFKYYTFIPVHFDIVYEALKDKYDEPFIRDGYGYWTDLFFMRANTFFGSQYDRHTRLLFKDFRYHYRLNPDLSIDTIPFYLVDDFTYYANSNGLEIHYYEKERALRIARSYMEGNHVSHEPDDDICAIARWLDRPGPHYEDLAPEIWGVWFDSITYHFPEVTESLRKLPYSEYLLTNHWRRIRAAVILAYRLHCSSSECEGLDSWYGGEHDLNVHHLHYRNKGAEKLEDLVLLCNDCHQRVHAGDTKIIELAQTELMA